MTIEYIKDMDTLIDIVESNDIVPYPNGAEGRRFLDWLRYTDRADNVVCVMQRSAALSNKFICGFPLVHLGVMPYLKDKATFIIAGIDKVYAGMNNWLVADGCKTIYCLHADVRKALKDELSEMTASGTLQATLMHQLTEQMIDIDQQFDVQEEICKTNTATFERYRNCNRGKKVVIVGDGETAQYYKPIPDAIHIALDGAHPREDITFNFRFNYETGTLLDNDRNEEFPIALSNGAADQVIYQDITCHPLSTFGETGGGLCHAALHFAAFTFPDAIYLVGCDETEEDADTLLRKLGYSRLKLLIGTFYPETKIRSINPVGLKGIFDESYTESYEMELETKALLESEPEERITLNNQRLGHVWRAVEDNDFVAAFNDLMAMMSDTPKESLTLYSDALLDIWQLAQSKASSDEKAIEQKQFECALVVALENMLALTTALEYPLDVEGELPLSEGDAVGRLNDFPINGVRQSVARKHWATANRFAAHVERLNFPLGANDNVLMAQVCYNNERHDEMSEYVLRAAGVGKFSKVMVTDTVLTTLLYLLMFDDWRDSCFVTAYSITQSLIDKLLQYGAPGFYSKRFFANIDADKVALNRLATYVKENKIPVYGHDHLPDLSEPFIDENFSVIEDGMGNYREKAPHHWRTLADGTRYTLFGYDKLTKRVYLTGRLPVPDLLKDKAIVLDMMECWQRKSPEERAIIADVFNVPMARLLELFAQGRDQILLTQPMYEVLGGSDWAERKRRVIDFYRKVLARFDKSRVFIKVHPRDANASSYHKHFPDYPIMTDKFPFEFMKLLGLTDKIDKLISVHCTANHGIVDDSKVVPLLKEWQHFVKTGELD